MDTLSVRVEPFARSPLGRKHVGDLEIAVAEYLDWYNQHRLRSELEHVPQAKHETEHWATQQVVHHPRKPTFAEVVSS